MKMESTDVIGAAEAAQGGERVVWEFHTVALTRVPGYGFGIAVSGGRDNPHFTNGDPSIAISDVLKAGPAEGKLQVNDRLISANGVSLENVEYARAVQVLRDSGASVHLVVKRRIVLPSSQEPQTLKISLPKNRKKDDFGIVLGCRIYVRDVTSSHRSAQEKDGSVREGDVLLRINGTSTENLSLKEAKKLLDAAKDRVQLVVRREPSPARAQPDLTVKDTRMPDYGDGRPNYASQNLYVQPPSRTGDVRGPSYGHYGMDPLDSKSNLTRSGYNSRLGMSSPGEAFFDDTGSPLDDPLPPRPPLPRPEDYFLRQSGKDDCVATSPPKGPSPPVPDPRFVSFKKEGSVGIRLTGGNEVGIYVTAVQPGSQAQLQGLIPGDKILKVNDMEMSGVTREEAVLYLMSLQEQIDLIVQTRWHDYEHILANQKGDLFYIKTHFHYEPNGKNELSFRSGDIFRVVDTLHNGVVGSWQVHRMGRNNQETQKGIIPNKSRAEELATAQFNAAKKEQTQSESRSGFFRRRRNSRRSKSLGKDHWEDVVFADSVSKFPAYERVALRHPGFVRPVVIFGPLADVAQDKLLAENQDKFASPRIFMHLDMPIPHYGHMYSFSHISESDGSGEKPSGIIRLSAIREIVDRGKHGVLDITPNAVDRLNYAQFYPVVIFLRAESKQIVKELRTGLPKSRMSNKKLFDQSVKSEKLWSHIFTATISLTQPDTWYRKVKEIIDKQQSAPVWISETKPVESVSDDFLFPMTSRLSYASSPESDAETNSEARSPCKSPGGGSGRPSTLSSYGESRESSRGRLMRSSSDPSVAAPEEPMAFSAPGGGPPPYTASPIRTPPGLGLTEGIDDRRKSQGGDSKYGFSSGMPYGSSTEPHQTNSPLGSPTSSPVKRSPGVPAFVTSPPSYNGYGQGRGPPTHPGASTPQSPQPRLPQSPLARPHPTSSSSFLYSSPVGNFPSQLNGGGSPGDTNGMVEPPPRVDRTSKPGRPRTELESNYMNSLPGNSLERRIKSPYDTGNLGPDLRNAHDDLKSRMHPSRSAQDYRYARSASQPPTYRMDDPYRLSGYKPMPPPKNNAYKPVPPPKPKHYRPQMGSHMEGPYDAQTGGGQWGIYGDPHRPSPHDRPYYTGSNGGLSDDYSGLDSGQGSSLDRKYDTFGRSSYGKVGSTSGTRSGGGYYLNVPPPRDMMAPGGPTSQQGGGAGRGDLPNHDHRGSAFELYKKPADPPRGQAPMPVYHDFGAR